MQGDLRRNIAAKHNKLIQLRKQLDTTQLPSQWKSYKAQITRALHAYYRAHAQRQQVAMKRRYTIDMIEEFETMKQTYDKLKPCTTSAPVNMAIGTTTDANGRTTKISSTTNEGIHKIFYIYWCPIFQMPHDIQKGTHLTAPPSRRVPTFFLTKKRK